MFATWSLGYDSIDHTLLTGIRRYLAQQEATNCIQLSGFVDDVGAAPGTSVILARNGQDIRGVASHSGTFLMLLSHIEDPAAIAVMVNSLLANGSQIPGVMGPADVALAFAERWARLTDGRFTPGMPQRILRATSVTPPAGVPGSVRPMTPDDRPMLIEWFAEFSSEAEHIPPAEAHRAGEALVARLGFESGGLVWLNEQGTPVSIACYKGRTPHGIRVGPVFTPADQRRHGYAAAVTAAATRRLLDRGFQATFLYTDATNLTANHVYESIGYEPVTDTMQYRFHWAFHDDMDE